MSRYWPRALLVALSLIAGTHAGDAASSAPAPIRLAVCRIIESTAEANRLPVEYLSRLVWTESRFDAGAVSPAGAEGIAQFMPETAAERGLENPWDPASSISHAARLLADLHRRFGNLGLAAAAYNAGPGRLAGWLRGTDQLPGETQIYVELVTGRPLDQWLERTAQSTEQRRSCTDVIAEASRNSTRFSEGRSTGWYPLLPVTVSTDGELVSRTSNRPLTAGERLAVHNALSRIVGLPSAGSATTSSRLITRSRGD